MRTWGHRTVAGTLLGVLAVFSLPFGAAAAKPGPTSAKHDGSAQIRSAAGDILTDDGKGSYAHPHGGTVWARDYFDASAEDLFALYSSNTKRTFSVTFGDPAQTHVCPGISHVFFEAPAWWEATSSEGDTVRGSVGIWCEKADGTMYAVRYPGYPRSPSTDGDDCVVIERVAHDVSGERKYVIAPPVAVTTPQPEPDPLPPLPVIDEPEPDPEPAAPCPARVYSVEDSRSGRTSTLLWEGEAAFEITAVLR